MAQPAYDATTPADVPEADRLEQQTSADTDSNETDAALSVEPGLDADVADVIDQATPVSGRDDGYPHTDARDQTL